MQTARIRITSPTSFPIVAEVNGRVAGSSFLNERDPIRGVGPVSVDPTVHALGIGRQMMEAIVERGRTADGVRLTQDAFNTVSMPLYASLGFDVKEPLVLIEGRPRSVPETGVQVRRMTSEDIDACEALCLRAHGFPRTRELHDALQALSPYVLVRSGRIAAYATAVSKRGHGIAEREEDMAALLLGIAATGPASLSFLLPSRQAGLFRWCLREGLRVIKPLSLMALGAYQEPRGCYFPSIQY